MTSWNGFVRPLGVALWVSAALCGCDRMDDAAVQTEGRLRVISAAYLEFAAARGKGPENETELRAQLANSAAAKFLSQELGMTDTALVLASARDGAPFVVRFGVPIDASPGESASIACEARGSGGTRFVAFADGRVECVAAEDVAPQSEVTIRQGGSRP